MRLRTRHVALAVAVVALVAGFAVGTGGFSSMSADRGVSISVADDENAYLGIEADEPDTVRANALASEDERKTALLTLTNRFSSAVTIDARAPDSGGSLSITDIETVTLNRGESGSVMANVTCDKAVDKEVTVEINASGTGIEVKTDEQVAIDCAPATPTTTTLPDNRTTDDATGTTTEAERTPEDTSTTEDTPTATTVRSTENEPTTDATLTSTAVDGRTNTSS